MSADIRNNNNNNKKSILLVTDNIQHSQQQFNNYNINNYKITFANWNDILTFITNSDYDINKRNNLELLILDISTTVAAEYEKINQISTTITTVGEIKKILYDKRIFFILPYEYMIETFLFKGIYKQEDIHIQPFSVFDIIDLISITNKKERLDRLKLKDHCMNTYSSIDDKVKDAIKFLKIGIKNNETTLLLLSRDIDLVDFKSQLVLSDLDINKLQDDRLLKITYTEKFYLSFNQKNNNKNKTAAIDGKKVHEHWKHLIDRSINNGRNGL